ncbi:MAG: hypothetical protein WC459_02095 [Patescibacteria group bacterium]
MPVDKIKKVISTHASPVIPDSDPGSKIPTHASPVIPDSDPGSKIPTEQVGITFFI